MMAKPKPAGAKSTWHNDQITRNDVGYIYNEIYIQSIHISYNGIYIQRAWHKANYN